MELSKEQMKRVIEELESSYNSKMFEDKNLEEIIRKIREYGYDPELVNNYLLDKRFIRELEDDKEYNAA